MPSYPEKRIEAVVFEKTIFSFGTKLYQCEFAIVSLASYEAEVI